MARIITQAADRWIVTEADGRQVASCKTVEAAQRIRDQRSMDIAHAASQRSEADRLDAEEAAEARAKLEAIMPRLRKVVSREPGFSVNRLGDRCEAVYQYWGAPVRSVIVLMADGASHDLTLPLSDDDICQIESIPELWA